MTGGTVPPDQPHKNFGGSKEVIPFGPSQSGAPRRIKEVTHRIGTGGIVCLPVARHRVLGGSLVLVELLGHAVAEPAGVHDRGIPEPVGGPSHPVL